MHLDVEEENGAQYAAEPDHDAERPGTATTDESEEPSIATEPSAPGENGSTAHAEEEQEHL